MFPTPPRSRRPTNYYWILLLCVGAMLVVLFSVLRSWSTRFNAALADSTAISLPLPSTQSRPLASLVAQATPTAETAGSQAFAAETQATPTGGAMDVDPQTLTNSPANYRSRIIRVRGTVFYTGRLSDGKTWIQIVGGDNVYVDGQTSEPLPSGITKGSDVYVTGIGAGLTNVTASNGKDYDQAYIDPIQKIELAR
jgi:hypothetical protein